MSIYKILTLAGDGIGPEVMAEAIKILKTIEEISDLKFSIEEALIGGCAYEEYGKPLPDESLKLAKDADAVLLGAVGGPKWDQIERSLRPERALLAIRSELELFANFRPAIVFDELVESSTLKKEVIQGVDFLVVRELTGGIYFGKPRGIETKNGERVGTNTYVYSESEIRRIAKVAFEAAQKRNKKLTSVDKANVLEVTELWKTVIIEESKNYPDVELSHIYVDNATMQVIRAPKQFDVIVTGNMFGDILSDAAAMITGSIGMLPSASLDKNQKGMYEPVHGSAPDIAGHGKANPLATLLSVAMMLKYSFNDSKHHDLIFQAVKNVLKNGHKTFDLAHDSSTAVSTAKMGDLVKDEILKICKSI